MTSNSGNECMMTAASTDLFSQLQRLRLSDGTSAGERIRTTVVTTPPAERNQLPRTMSITSSTSNGSGAAMATTRAARHHSHDSLSVPFASPQSTLTLPEYTTYTPPHSNGGSNSRDVAPTQGPHARRSSSMHQQQQPQHHQHGHDVHHEAVSMPDLASLAMHVSNKQQQQQQQCVYDEDVSRRTMMSNNSVVSGSNQHNNNYSDVSSSVASPLGCFAARNAYTLTHVPAPTQQQTQPTAFAPSAHVSSSGYASDAVSASLAEYNNSNSYTVMHSPYVPPQSSMPHLSATQRPVSSPSLHTGTTLTLASAPAGMSTVTPRAPVAVAVEPLHPTVLQFLQNALPGTTNNNNNSNNKGNTTSSSTSTTTMTGANEVSALVAFASTLPATTMFARAPESVCASATVQSGMSATATAVAAAVATTVASTSSNNNNNNNGVTVDSQAATPTATVSPSTRDKRSKHKQQQQQQQQCEGVAYDKPSMTLTMDAVRVDAIRTAAPRAVAAVAAQRADVNKARRSDSNNHTSQHNEDDNTPPLPPPQQSPQQKQQWQQQQQPQQPQPQHDAALAMTDDTGGSNSSHSRSSSSGGSGSGTRRRRGSLDSGAAHTQMTVAAAIAANAFVCEALGCAWTDNTCVRTPIIRTVPDVPQGGRYIVVGDVHGCVAQLEALVAKVKYVQGRDCLIIIGDYVNKGPDSVGVVRACQRLRALGVLGNHDYTLLRCCAQHRRRRYTPQELRDPVKQLACNFPLECEYYLRSLPHMLRLPAYGVLLVHAGVNAQYALEAQSIREIMHMRRLVPVSATSGEPTTTSDSSSHGNNNNDDDDDNDDDGSSGRATGSSLATKATHTRTCEQQQQHKDTTGHMRVTVGSGAAKKTMFVTTTTTSTAPLAATATTTAAGGGVRYRVLEKGHEGTPWAALWSGPPHIVFGHDAYAGFQCHPHAYGIDTGCVYGDPLTCVVYSAAAPRGEFYSVPGLPRYSNERLGLPPPSADIYEQLQSSDVSSAIIRPTTSASLATTTTTGAAAAAAAATARCTPAAFLTTPPSIPALTSSSTTTAAAVVRASAHTFLATPMSAPATRAHGGHTVVMVGAGATRTRTMTTTMAVAAATTATATTTDAHTQHGSALHTPVLEGNAQAWRGMRLPSPATLPPSVVTSARGASVTATQQHNNNNNNNCAASPSSLMSGALDKAASISVREVQKATLLALSATHELRALVTVLMMPLYERHYDAMMQDDVDDNVAQQSFWCPFVQAVLEAVLQLTSSSSTTSSGNSNGKGSDDINIKDNNNKDNNNKKKEHNEGCGGHKSWNGAGQHAAAMMLTGTSAAAAATSPLASIAPQTYVTALALMEECVDYVMHFVLPVCEAMRYVRTTVRPQLRAVAADATPGLWSRAVQKYVAMVLQQADEDDDDENDAKGRCGGGSGDNNKDNKNKSSNTDGEAAHARRV